MPSGSRCRCGTPTASITGCGPTSPILTSTTPRVTIRVYHRASGIPITKLSIRTELCHTIIIRVAVARTTTWAIWMEQCTMAVDRNCLGHPKNLWTARTANLASQGAIRTATSIWIMVGKILVVLMATTPAPRWAMVATTFCHNKWMVAETQLRTGAPSEETSMGNSTTSWTTASTTTKTAWVTWSRPSSSSRIPWVAAAVEWRSGTRRPTRPCWASSLRGVRAPDSPIVMGCRN